MKLKDITLTEVIDTAVELRPKISTPLKFAMDATINGRTVRYQAILKMPGPPYWEFSFFEIDDDGDEHYDATGNGGELAVFSGAKAFLIHCIAAVKPAAVFFAASKTDGDARASLYRRFLKRWQPSGYEVYHVADNSEAQYYALVKKSHMPAFKKFQER